MNELHEFLNKTKLSPYIKGDAKKITKKIKKILDDVVRVRHYDGNDGNKYTEIAYFEGGEYYCHTHCWG